MTCFIEVNKSIPLKCVFQDKFKVFPYCVRKDLRNLNVTTEIFDFPQSFKRSESRTQNEILIYI